MLIKLRVYFTRARIFALIGAICIGSFTSYTVTIAQQTKHAYGSRSSVVRTKRAISAGDLVDVGSTEIVEMPTTFAPQDALESLDSEGPARHDMASGQIVTSLDLATTNASPTVAQIPIGWRAITIPADVAPPDFEAGDHCDLWVSAAPAGSQDDFSVTSKSTTTKPSTKDGFDESVALPLALQLSTNALVIDRRNERITVAVRDKDVEVIVAAMATASIIAVALPAS